MHLESAKLSLKAQWPTWEGRFRTKDAIEFGLGRPSYSPASTRHAHVSENAEPVRPSYSPGGRTQNLIGRATAQLIQCRSWEAELQPSWHNRCTCFFECWTWEAELQPSWHNTCTCFFECWTREAELQPSWYNLANLLCVFKSCEAWKLWHFWCRHFNFFILVVSKIWFLILSVSEFIIVYTFGVDKKKHKCSIRKGFGGFEVGLGGFGQVFGPGRQKNKKEAPPSSGHLFFGMLIQDTAMDITFG